MMKNGMKKIVNMMSDGKQPLVILRCYNASTLKIVHRTIVHRNPIQTHSFPEHRTDANKLKN
jgi:hypothetical protein